jgi:hypothetical protein
MRLGRYFMVASAVVVLLTAMLAGRIVFTAWQTYSEGVGGLSALATFSDALRAAEKVSLERGPMNALVAARVPNDPEWRAKLDKARANTDASFDALTATLPRSGIRNVAGAAAALTEMRAHLASIRARADELYVKPLAQRDVATYRALLAEMISLVTGLAPIESDTEARVGAEDTDLVKAAYVARLAAELREFAGRLGSVFAGPLSGGKPFLSAESYAVERIDGRLNALEDQLDREIEAANVSRITQAGIAMHEAYFTGAMALVDRIVLAGRSNGRYPVTGPEFVAAYVPAMATIFAVRDAALDEALGIALAKRDRARLALPASRLSAGEAERRDRYRERPPPLSRTSRRDRRHRSGPATVERRDARACRGARAGVGPPAEVARLGADGGRDHLVGRASLGEQAHGGALRPSGRRRGPPVVRRS